MDTRPFYFKQFSMHHHCSTMKIGTDAVLLARWVSVNETDSVVDIGSGSGVMDLMLAQRGVASVDAVEIDTPSVEESDSNFKASPWADRLHVHHADIKDFVKKANRYDLVISNPPFFTDFLKGEQQRRNLARHTDSLSFSDLVASVVALMKPDARFVLVLPALESVNFKQIAASQGLYQSKQLSIVPVEGKKPNRLNMEFVLTPTTCVDESFVIRKTDGSFTDAYNIFLKDFYLNL